MKTTDHRRYLVTMSFALAASPLLLALYIAVAPENFEVREYGIWTAQLDFASRPSERDPRVLIIGDSTIHAALIPDLVARDARSVALGGSSPIDAYYQLVRYLEHHQAPDVLILSFSPRHLSDRSFSHFWKRSVRYGAHDRRDFEEILSRSTQLGVPLLPHQSALRARLEWWLYRVKFPPYYLGELKNANHVERRGLNQQTRRKIDEARGHVLYGTADGPHPVAWEADQRSFEASPLHDDYLRDCLDLAGRHDVRVFVAATAFSESTLDAMNGRFIRDYWHYISDVAKDHPTVHFEEGFPSLPDDYFGDSTHVNETGARALSVRMASIVERLRSRPDSHALNLEQR